MIEPPLDIQAAIRAAKYVALWRISFLELSGTVECDLEGLPSGSTRFSTPMLTAIWHRKDGEFEVLFPFRLHVVLEPNEAEAQPMLVSQVKVTLRLQYKFSEGSPLDIDEDLPHFAGINGFMHALPYFRSEVQSLTTKLGLEPLTLPSVVSGFAAENVRAVKLDEAKALSERESSTEEKAPDSTQ